MHLQHRQRGAVAAVAAAAAVTLILAGCSSSGTDDGGGGEATEEITYWLWDSNQQPAYQQCADAFTDETGIGVTHRTIRMGGLLAGPDHRLRLLDGARRVRRSPVLLPAVRCRGAAPRHLRPRRGGQVDLSIYQEGLAGLWVDQEGGRFGLPKDFDTVALFYNDQMVADAGFEAEISQRSSGTRPTAAATRSSSRR